MEEVRRAARRGDGGDVTRGVVGEVDLPAVREGLGGNPTGKVVGEGDGAPERVGEGGEVAISLLARPDPRFNVPEFTG